MKTVYKSGQATHSLIVTKKQITTNLYKTILPYSIVLVRQQCLHLKRHSLNKVLFIYLNFKAFKFATITHLMSEPLSDADN